jgi:S1-C subfamily serine protease
MIRRTLSQAQAATFSIDIPNPGMRGMPTPAGTGFFVSPDGWFVTAAHVVMKEGKPIDDLDKAWLMKEARFETLTAMCQHIVFDYADPRLDFAILKVDFEKNASKDHLKDQSGFAHLTASRRTLDEGEPVYAFGYPLPEPELLGADSQMSMGHGGHAPRTTSAIVSSTFERSGMVHTDRDPQLYVLDKALNYGNSGGPILAVETGHVHAFCSRFQPVSIPQPHLKDSNGKALSVWIPSLYGVVVGLNNPEIISELEKRGVPIVEN